MIILEVKISYFVLNTATQIKFIFLFYNIKIKENEYEMEGSKTGNADLERNKKHKDIISGWFIRPLCQNEHNLQNTSNSNEKNLKIDDESLKIAILYLHGSGGNRSAQYRCDYQKLNI